MPYTADMKDTCLQRAARPVLLNPLLHLLIKVDRSHED